MRMEINEGPFGFTARLELLNGEEPVVSVTKMLVACDAFAQVIAKNSNGLVTPQDVRATLADALYAGGLEGLKGGVLNG